MSQSVQGWLSAFQLVMQRVALIIRGCRGERLGLVGSCAARMGAVAWIQLDLGWDALSKRAPWSSRC